MHFPVYVGIGALSLHPHQVFETLAYVFGFLAYFHGRRRHGDVLEERQRVWVVVAAVLGGLAGSRILYAVDDPGRLAGHWADTEVLFAGKSIVGGLLGGLMAVEWIKKRLGVAVATGDLLAMPLAIGIGVGRVGCFLTGLADETHGNVTNLPWAVDFGDGMPRHPTQLYEIAYLCLLAVLLGTRGRHFLVEGDRFKLFMLGYLGFRLIADFLKPAVPVLGLSVIQWACLAGLVYYAPHVPRLLRGIRHG